MNFGAVHGKATALGRAPTSALMVMRWMFGVVPIAVERGESDGSGFTMLRDLALQVWSGFDVARERGIEALHVTEATHGAKAAGCFV